MARTAIINTRVDSVVKERAEEILDRLGIPMSIAIGMFLRQVVMRNGIPFDVRRSVIRPLVYGELTKEQFDAEIQKGIDDLAAGRLCSAADISIVPSGGGSKKRLTRDHHGEIQ